MALQYRVRITSKRGDAPCHLCEEIMLNGKPHITVSMRMGKSPRGKDRWKVVHLHVQCIVNWLIAEYVAWQNRTPKPTGRPLGSSPIPNLTDEERKRRHYLVALRGRLIREIIETGDIPSIKLRYDRLTEVSREMYTLGGPVRINLAHRRNEESKQAVRDKLALAGVTL